MLALILVAVSVGLGNLAASVGIGVGGVTVATRMRVVLTFGLLEGGMPIIGLLIGHSLASSIGREAKWIAAVLLAGVGIYGIIAAIIRNRRDQEGTDDPPALRASSAQEWTKLTISAFALSLDNLIAGFALGSYQVNLAAGALAFGLVSIVLSLGGLEIGARLGGRAGDSGEIIGGIVLIGVGVAVGFGVLG
ncbi:MAG TPA: manganese efflux pump [Streptosporangiaceae bacterium]|nr:manganese efflux pump [Streptosporangiaceae bacterium]